MGTATKEMTTLRINPDMLELMKERARGRGMSLNAYLVELAAEDLRTAGLYPKVSLSGPCDEDLVRISGKGAAPDEDWRGRI